MPVLENFDVVMNAGRVTARSAPPADPPLDGPDEIRRAMAEVDFWWHSIDLGHGIATSGAKSGDSLEAEVAALQLPDVRGRTVLDIGTWDGFYAFAAERMGAQRVVALDQYVWSIDLGPQQQYWRECRDNNVAPEPYHERAELWKPDSLPGKAGYDTAHRALSSDVETLVGDFEVMDLGELGSFDIVLYLGVLYHSPDPFRALRRLAHVTRDRAIIETAASPIGPGDRALCEFFPGAELDGDVSNWWAPNRVALEGMCRAAGFAAVDWISPLPPPEPTDNPAYYRAIVHARK